MNFTERNTVVILGTIRKVEMSHGEAEVSTPRTAVVFDHVRSMNVTEDHEGDTAGRAHGLCL